MEKINYYNEISQGYEELHREEQLEKIEIIKKFLKPVKTDKLLDVGCGTGISTTSWNCEIYGLDSSIKLLDMAKEKNHPNAKWILASSQKIPFRDNFFDYVISVTALGNFEDIDKGLSEIKRVGKNNFILTFLKHSPKKEKIIKLIRSKFKVLKEYEQKNDLIFICRKNI